MQTLSERIAEIDEDVLLANGFEMAFVGLAERCGSPLVAVYDRDACIRLLASRDGMSEEDAEEFFDFNVIGAYVGEKTPWFITWKGDGLLASDGA